jgi:hypothetical protein
MVKIKEPNALNFFNLRKAQSLPSWFESVSIPYTYNIEDALNKWIYKNLKGRFYVGKGMDIDNSNSIATVIKVGFEDHKEMAYFMLACPLLKY